MSAYDGRTVDILAMQGVAASGKKEVGLNLGTSGFVCTGIQKVAQEFLTLFLTDRGSVKWDPDYGTSFMYNLRTGQINDETTLQSAFEFAVIDIINYLGDTLATATPDDEVLENAELVEWDLRPGFLSIKVQITTTAGNSREYIVPIRMDVE